MLKNSKIKKMLALSVCSGAFFVGGMSASAVIKKTTTSAVGASSTSSTRKTVLGSYLNTWSSFNGRMNDAKSKIKDLQKKNTLRKPDSPIEGKFINTSGDEIIVNVYSKTSDEGLEVLYVKTTDGDEVVVTTVGGGFYARSLSLEELKLFDKVNHGFLNTGIDTLGREHIIVVADGESVGELAYQFSNGTWRDIHRDGERKIYLGHQVDVGSLSDGLKNRLFEDIKGIIDSASTVGFSVPNISQQ